MHMHITNTQTHAPCKAGASFTQLPPHLAYNTATAVQCVNEHVLVTYHLYKLCHMSSRWLCSHNVALLLHTSAAVAASTNNRPCISEGAGQLRHTIQGHRACSRNVLLAMTMLDACCGIHCTGGWHQAAGLCSRRALLLVLPTCRRRTMAYSVVVVVVPCIA